ncbi:MAG: alpha/beta hydrolase [Chitinophagales bacterium]
MKKNMYIVSMLISLVFTYSCRKAEGILKDDSIKNTTNEHHSNAKLGTGSTLLDPLTYLMNLDNPNRDEYFSTFLNPGTPFSSSLLVGGGGYPPAVQCCSDICMTGTFQAPNSGGWCGTIIPNANYVYIPGMSDSWGNKIWYTAKYGSDARQMYYIYYPTTIPKTANSPIVVLIHGGGWSGGPDPTKVNGFNSVYTQVNLRASNNLVKNLLEQGYVVIAPLYRLVQVGDNNTDILTGSVSVQTQINDIDACITHIKTNFPSCLNLNANSIQVLGESAGGHLAMMYAYTKANTSYVKSVVSVSGPANMNQMANYIWNKPKVFNSGNDYIWRDPNLIDANFRDNHFPFYGVYDPAVAAQTNTVSAIVNPPIPLLGKINTYLKNLSWTNPTPVNIITPASSNTNKRVANNYNLAQSLVHQIISNPLTSTALANISPCAALNSSRIVPTFLIHGNDDWVVPYQFSDSTMDLRLSAVGGLIGTYTSTGTTSSPGNIPTSYTGLSAKHIIKLYGNDGTLDSDSPLRDGHSNHDVANNLLAQPDILTWLNGHK